MPQKALTTREVQKRRVEAADDSSEDVARLKATTVATAATATTTTLRAFAREVPGFTAVVASVVTAATTTTTAAKATAAVATTTTATSVGAFARKVTKATAAVAATTATAAGSSTAATATETSTSTFTLLASDFDADFAASNSLTIQVGNGLVSAVSTFERHETKSRAVSGDPNLGDGSKLSKRFFQLSFISLFFKTTNVELATRSFVTRHL